jgi:hypothetical protein
MLLEEAKAAATVTRAADGLSETHSEIPGVGEGVVITFPCEVKTVDCSVDGIRFTEKLPVRGGTPSIQYPLIPAVKTVEDLEGIYLQMTALVQYVRKATGTRGRLPGEHPRSYLFTIAGGLKTAVVASISLSAAKERAATLLGTTEFSAQEMRRSGDILFTSASEIQVAQNQSRVPGVSEESAPSAA